jgi:hypothetical protein
MSQNERFTSWLTPAERAALKAKAREWHASENYVLRYALRDFLGMNAAPPSPHLTMVEETA